MQAIPEALASNGSGGVFVVGTANGDVGGPNQGIADVWIAHYSALGNRLWILQFGSEMVDRPTAAAPDGFGGVYVAGITEGSLPGPKQGDRDGWIARYDASGRQLWITQFGSSEYDSVTDATVDSDGGVILCGNTSGDLAAPNAGIGDPFVVRFDPSGAMSWASQFGSADQDLFGSVAADAAGGAYVAGHTQGTLTGPSAGGFDVWFAHYDAVGTQTFLRQLGTPGDDLLRVAIPDASGGLFLTGSTQGDLGTGGQSAGTNWLGHFDSSGNEIWLSQFGIERQLAALDGAPNEKGGVYLGGFVGLSPGPANTWTGRFDDIATETYCSPAVANSTGTEGKVSASGSGVVAMGDLVLRADDLPPSSFGYFLNSLTRDMVVVAGSPGVLCLGAPVGRFTGLGEVQNSGGAGMLSLAIDLTSIAQPNGAVTVQPGDTWHFQAWHRDLVGGTASSNFTNGLSVMFQ